MCCDTFSFSLLHCAGCFEWVVLVLMNFAVCWLGMGRVVGGALWAVCGYSPWSVPLGTYDRRFVYQCCKLAYWCLRQPSYGMFLLSSSILPFFHSSILPFFHSSILPFFHSSILPFFHSSIPSFYPSIPSFYYPSSILPVPSSSFQFLPLSFIYLNHRNHFISYHFFPFF
jgi:hypothetical protein